MKRIYPVILSLGLALLFGGCVTVPPKDYTEFRKHQPKSILVLPPMNETSEVMAGYSVLTATTAPIAESGYYVVPVVLADRFLKENGLPTAAEMHQAPIAKLHEVFGADAVLYITVQKYGSKYVLISSNTYLFAKAKLVDCKTGIVLWENHVELTMSGQGGLVEALVQQVVNKLVDQAHVTALVGSGVLLTDPNQGLLKGPRHPEFGKTP
jgi:hypothetical protein